MYNHLDLVLLYCRCIHELLGNKLVVLVTHQIQYALKAHKILVIKEVSLLFIFKTIFDMMLICIPDIIT